MLSSNSSGFQKDLTATRVYDLEDPALGQSSIDFVQSLDEFDLEQSCLLRLKAQRQKIEQLTKLYQQNEKQLTLRSERQKKLQQEVQKLSDLSEYKQSYTQLKRDYQALSKKEQTTSEQFERLRKEYDEVITASEEEVQRLQGEIRLQRQQRLLAESHWQALMADKEEQLRKQTRAAQERQAQLVDRLNKIQQQAETLRQSVLQKSTELQSTSFELGSHIKAKEEEIVNYDKLIQCMRRQLSDYKAKLLSCQTEWQKERGQLSQVIDQLKMQVRIFRKDQSQKQNQIYQYKQMIKRCDNKNQNLEQSVNSLKTNLKKVKGNMDTSIKKLTSCSEQEKGKLQLFVQQLKGQLQRQMDEKNTLALQIKRLRSCIQRKEQQQKQRKLLLMSEFREIDKMEKVVKKII